MRFLRHEAEPGESKQFLLLNKVKVFHQSNYNQLSIWNTVFNKKWATIRIFLYFLIYKINSTSFTNSTPSFFFSSIIVPYAYVPYTLSNFSFPYLSHNFSSPPFLFILSLPFFLFLSLFPFFQLFCLLSYLGLPCPIPTILSFPYFLSQFFILSSLLPSSFFLCSSPFLPFIYSSFLQLYF